MRRLTTGIGECRLLHQVHKLFKREDTPHQILDGKRFDLGGGVPDAETAQEGIDVLSHVLSIPLLADVVGFQINIHTAIRAYPAHIASAIYGSQPPIRVNPGRQLPQRGQVGKGYRWWSVLARAPLVRSLLVVVLLKCLCNFTHLLKSPSTKYL